jgi:hypothetical protein
MPNLGSGLSFGSFNKIPGYDYDAFSYITENSIPQSASVSQVRYNNLLYPSYKNPGWTTASSGVLTPNAGPNPFLTANDAGLASNIAGSYGEFWRYSSSTLISPGWILPDQNCRMVQSIYAKAITANSFISFRCSSTTTDQAWPRFNLTTGAYTPPSASTNTNYGIVSTDSEFIGDGWYRFSICFNATNPTGTLIDFGISSQTLTHGVSTTAGTHRAWVWGAQLEVVETNRTLPTTYTERELLAYGVPRPNGVYAPDLVVNPQALINEFVVGCKSLNVWNSLASWSFRSWQNKTNSATLSCLGGLNLTLTLNGMNPIVQDSTGITFDGSDDYARISPGLTGGTAVFNGNVGTIPITGNKGNLVTLATSATPAQDFLWLNPRTGFGAEYRFLGSGFNLSENCFPNIKMDSTLGVVGLQTRAFRNDFQAGNASTTASALATNTLASNGQVDIARYAGGYSGKSSYFFIIKYGLLNSSSFYNLYKSTLGVGLGDLI